MKKYLRIGFFFLPLLMSCGNNRNSRAGDSAIAADSRTVKVDHSKPHEVRKGKSEDYAFMPDTAVNSIILGNPDCLRKYFLPNGSMKVSLGGKRQAMVYYNNSTGMLHEMELRTTENKKGEEVVYSMILQRKDEKNAPTLSVKSIPSADFNFISGHGIYIGMPYDHVLSVYSNQVFMEWEKGDTLYLHYKPKPKDRNYYKRFKPGSYSVTYKFVEGNLRRMEYCVDPTEFEN